MKARDGITSIRKEAWRALEPSNFPFADYEFLQALEASGAVGDAAGWIPRVLLDDDQGASYLYVKDNSYGEYIFDWAWAEAYHRHGLAYYPKVVSSVPFTPATGPKLLFAEGVDREEVAARLLEAGKRIAEEAEASSLHYLFLTPEEIPYFEKAGLLIRHSFQYHWKNRDFATFDDYLGTLKSRKRKEIVKERREVRAANVELLTVTGRDLTMTHADTFHAFYSSTVEKKGAIGYLNADFFRRLFTTMSNRVVLFLALEGDKPIAGSLYLHKGDALFGRYWGASKEIRHLHFELGYYQPIEYAIAHGVKVVEAGAQGEHKIARGFLPELTYSAHWIRHPAFAEAIARFIDEEKRAIAGHFAALATYSPFKTA